MLLSHRFYDKARERDVSRCLWMNASAVDQGSVRMKIFARHFGKLTVLINYGCTEILCKSLDNAVIAVYSIRGKIGIVVIKKCYSIDLGILIFFLHKIERKRVRLVKA